MTSYNQPWARCLSLLEPSVSSSVRDILTLMLLAVVEKIKLNYFWEWLVASSRSEQTMIHRSNLAGCLFSYGFLAKNSLYMFKGWGEKDNNLWDMEISVSTDKILLKHVKPKTPDI